MTGPRLALALVAVLAVALAARVAAVLLIDVDPRAGWAFDASWYDGVARRLLAGRGYVGVDRAPTAHWPPGYPLLLAGVYRLFGPSLLAAKLVNALLGTATVLLTYAIGRELRRPRVGLVAAAMLAVLPGDVLFAPALVSEPFFGVLFCGSLWTFLRWSNRGPAHAGAWLAFGGLLGLATLVRGVALVVLPTFTLTWLARGTSLRSTLWYSGAATAGLVIVLLPWQIRNHVQLGYPVVVATNGAAALWVGHSRVATGEHTFAMLDSWRARFGHLRKLPNPQAEVEIARAEVSEALGAMIARPDRVVALAPAKIYHMYEKDRGAYPWVEAGLRKLLGPVRLRWFDTLLNAYYLAVLGLAVVGSRHFRARDGRGAVLLPITVAWFTLMHAALFFGSSRFHHPLLPVLCLMAAAELLAWADALTGRRAWSTPSAWRASSAASSPERSQPR